MAIYRSFLEEDLELGGVIDDDNCVELKQIEDAIADSDANADEQDCAQAAEFGCSDGVDDILDEMSYAIAENEMNNNKIMMAIGVYELNESVNGRTIVYEAADIKTFIDRVKTKIVNFFKKVWAALKKAGGMVAAAFKTNKAFVTKYEKQIRSGATAYAASHKGDNRLTGYGFDGLQGYLSSGTFGSAADFASKYFAKAKNWNDNEIEGLGSAEQMAGEVRKYREKLCGTACDAGEFREKMKDHLYGDKEKMVMGADTVINALKSGDVVKRVAVAMDNSKKEFKDCIKMVDNLSKSFEKTDKKEKDEVESGKNNDAMSACVRLSSFLDQCLVATQVARAAVISASRAYMMQARKYAMAYVSAAGGTKAKNESANPYGFLAGLDLT